MTKRSSKSLLLFMAMGLVSGLLSPIQTSINSQLRLTVGSPFVASFISFLVGTTLLTLVCLIVERRLTFQLKGVANSLVGFHWRCAWSALRNF